MIKANRYLSEEKAIGYFKDLLKAFKMLVKNNIMHRDIKPENTLIEDPEKLIIKLTDFGFAKFFKEKDQANEQLGSPIYMPPEIVK